MSVDIDLRDAVEVADHIEVPVAAGSRVVVVSDLHLAAPASAEARVAIRELTQMLAGWTGPGAVVLAGDVIELVAGTGDPRPALAAHAGLPAELRSFAATPGRQVIYVVGNHDGRLAWDTEAARRLAGQTGARLAFAVDLLVETGRGTRRVRVEHGHRFDPANAFTDPRDPLDVPFGHHLLRQSLPALRQQSWLAGVERLADPLALPAFVCSRLVYRRMARHLAWLAIPLLVAVAVKVPLALTLTAGVSRAVGLAPWPHRLLVAAAILGADVALVGAVVALAARQTWLSLGNSVLAGRGRAQNDAPRAEARALAGDGYAGLITGHTHHAELSEAGDGFYANTGCCAEVVGEQRARFGLPPVFLPYRQLSWVELEAGADLHVRLLQSRVDVAAGTLLERLAVRSRPARRARPAVVAAWPQGPSWPPPHRDARPSRRTRRVAAGALAGAGLLNLASALTPPLMERLRWLRGVVPLAVPQAAAALTALSGLGLLLLARGVRRGQRRAWAVSLAVLAASAGFHLAKGVDVEEAVLALVVAAYLLAHRSAFPAPADRRGLRSAVLAAGAGAAAVTVVGAGSVEAVSRGGLPLGWAVVAAGERLVGLSTVPLPRRLDEFLSPAAAAVGFGLAALAGWQAFRPGRDRGLERQSLDGARAIVARHGGDTLAYFALRDDKERFFFGDTLIAYGVFGGVCLVSPDPVGPRWEREAAWAAFRRFADQRGWSVAVVGATEKWLPVYRDTGMHELYVGDEAIVDCTHFSLDCPQAKSLRQAVNRVARGGYRVEFFDPGRLDGPMAEALRRLATDSRRGEEERGFSMTLGRFLDPGDHDLLLAVARAASGEPVAFCQFVPAAGIDGYSLDMMRRSTGDHPNGLLDFVLVETILHLQGQGRRGLCLNFAVMRAVLAGETGGGVTQRAQRWLLFHLSDTMQIESLWRFNAKYDPDWRPRYAVYDSPEDLVPAALALARAESFWELPLLGRILAPRTRAGS